MKSQSDTNLGLIIKNLAVALYVPGKDSDNSTYLGKGILLNDEGQVLTAGHIVHDRPINLGKIHYMGDQRVEVYDVVDMVEFLEANDLAIIQTRFSKKNMRSQLRIPREFSYDVGVPLQLIDIEETSGYSQLVTQDGRIIPNDDYDLPTPSKEEAFKTSHKVREGNSGDPLLNLENELVGVAIGAKGLNVNGVSTTYGYAQCAKLTPLLEKLTIYLSMKILPL